jgi:hypothetical protein
MQFGRINVVEVNAGDALSLKPLHDIVPHVQHIHDIHMYEIMNTSLKCDQAHPQKKRSVIKHIVEAGMRS